MNTTEINNIAAILSNALGPKKILTDRDILDKYSRDETSDLEAFPDLVIRVECVHDVSTALKICSRHRIQVTPRGAGTGVTGGSVPVCGGAVLSLEKLNRIIEIDKDNMIAVVEPGAITGEIQNAVLAEGLMYPPDPASIETCSIGGNVAENAGGPKAVKYGTTSDYILGLEFVLADGSIINTGGKIVKNSTGYNLKGIILGSEGTLAIVTKIFLRLIPTPKTTKDMLIPFASLKSAMDAVSAILQNMIIPAAIEFMEEDALRLVSKHLNKNIPFSDAGAHLLIQVDGSSDEEVFSDIEKIAKSIDIDNEKIFVAETPSQRMRLWETRRSIREALRAESPVFFAEDTVVPRSKITWFLTDLKKYLKSINIRSVMFGHAGDGNIHIDILKYDMDYNKWKAMMPEIKKEIYKRAISCGGTITGEHGIGCLRKEFLCMASSNEAIELSKRIKSAFDPNMILNPGKIFV